MQRIARKFLGASLIRERMSTPGSMFRFPGNRINQALSLEPVALVPIAIGVKTNNVPLTFQAFHLWDFAG